jgi:hypothetical protein
MSTVLHPSPLTRPTAEQLSGRPNTRSLLLWGALVLVLHVVVLLSLAGPLDWQLGNPQTLRTGPMQTRAIATPAAERAYFDSVNTPAAHTRVALVEKIQPHSKSDTTKTPKAPLRAPADKPAAPQAPEQKLAPDPAQLSGLATTDPLPVNDLANESNSAQSAEKAMATVAGVQASDTVVAGTPASDAAPAPISQAQPTPAALNDKAQASEPPPNANQSVASIETGARPAAPGPEVIASATMTLPDMALASLPPSALLSYRLNGQEKGIHYQASGELRWQRNDSAYAMSLSVKAFLLGSRHWRSVGQINATGLAPTRFSDSWRSERAAHFDRPNQRIVFSSNAPTAPLQPGAQDLVSLYAQLAAAMAQSGQQMTPGTRLQVQTATVRDALPWLLTLEKIETLQVDGKILQAVKWVCQPRNRFDAQVEFWVTAAYDWLPARIRITQVSGNFIDLQLTGRASLGDLPPVQ